MKCPKCNGEMEKGKQMGDGLSADLIWIKEGKLTKFIESYTERK